MRWTVLAVLLACWGCNRPASIAVEPEQPLITSAQETVQLKATVKDSQGRALADQRVSFRSMTPTMATVDEGGVVRALTSGEASILVQAGEVTREVKVLVQLPKRVAIDPDSPMLMVGVTHGFKATIYDDRDRAMIVGKIRWSSSDPSVFTVDERGNVKTLQEGKARLMAHAPGIQGSTEVTVKHEELHEDGTLSQ